MAVKEIIAFDSKLLDTTSVYDSTQAKKQSAINADTLTALGTKINYTDALTLEEIEASTDLSNKVAAAAAVETLKDALSYKSLNAVTGTTPISIPSTWTEANVRLALGGTRYFSFHLVKSNFNFAAATQYNIRDGYYSDAGNNAYVSITLTTATNGSATVEIVNAVLTGSDVVSTSGLQVRYR